jgi:hypothetical protein
MKPFDRCSDAEFEALAREAARWPDAPPAWIRQALAAFPARTEATGLAGAVRRVVQAVLAFDSFAQPPLAMGVRGLPSEFRHLLFNTPGRDIDLRLAPAAEGFQLSGLVSAQAVADGQPTGAAHQAQLDAMGEFRIGGLRAGVYRLTLDLADEQVVLPDLHIGERQP